MATGEAAGTAAARAVSGASRTLRDVPIDGLRERLRARGAIVDRP